MFDLITPVSYWILTILWLVILGLYLGMLRQSKVSGGAVAVLLTILAIDAFRTVFESAYFGLYFNSLFGLLPKGIHDILSLPELIIIPKLINVIAGFLVLFLLIRRWVPREIQEREEWIQGLQDAKLYAEQRKEEAEQQSLKFKAIFNAISDAIVYADTDRHIINVNQGFEKTFGYTIDDLAGKSTTLLYESDEEYERQGRIRFNMLAEEQSKPYEVSYRRNNGEVFVGETLGTPIKGEKGEVLGFIGVIRDVSERIEAGEALRGSEDRFRDFAEASSDWFWEMDEQLRFTDISGGHRSSTNIDTSVFIGKTRKEIAANTKDNKWDQHYDDLENHRSFRDFTFELEIPDGSDIPISINGKPVFDHDGVFRGYRGTGSDTTETKNLEAQVRRSQKMEAIGQLTGGIAHDFNNILGIVMGNLELLKHMNLDDEKAMDRIDRALKGAKRGADITRKLLDFSREDIQENSLVLVNKLIEEQKMLISKSLTASIQVETKLAEDLWSVAIDPGDFDDAILNLSLNARDAMPDGGKILIETANKILEENYVKSNLKGTAGEFVMIAISDSGIGMTAETREKIFDPFFTTKERGKGTGLGLSMVYGFIQRSGGYTKIYSEVGYGTTIRLYIPRAHKRPIAEGTENDTATTSLNGKETILIADDEEDLLDVAVSYLGGLGYRTFSATNAEQAQKILEEHKDIDLLFSDVIMPGDFDGYQLALGAHKNDPSLKILLASGFTTKPEELVNDDNQYISQLNANMLSKPYKLGELAIAIRNIFDEDE